MHDLNISKKERISVAPLHGGRQQGGQRQGAAAALRGSALWRRGSACENGSRAAGQFTVPPLCLSAGMYLLVRNGFPRRGHYANILRGKAVRFFRI